MLITQLNDDVLSMVLMCLTLNEAFVARAVCRSFKVLVDRRCESIVNLLIRSPGDSGVVYENLMNRLTFKSDLHPDVIVMRRPQIKRATDIYSLVSLFCRTKTLVLNSDDHEVNLSLINAWHGNLTSLTYGLLQRPTKIPHLVWDILSEMTKLVDLTCYGDCVDIKCPKRKRVLGRLDSLVVESCPISWLSELKSTIKTSTHFGCQY